ncbi:MAG: 50S ribosomal protein L25 [Phycisphaeraceae bacterium]|nr:50S ribosomal protein L25 [Phycisphaeraceae bacterium]MCW5754208.1 50S ribosomal protein L25 [Phycisphaeraceae bacterium]
MHEDAPILTANSRARIGSRYARREREAGGLPAVVYGHKTEPVAVSFDGRETVKHINKGERVFRMALDGGQPEYILLKDLQFDHLGTRPVHADFMRVDLNEKVRVKVPVHLIGEARGLSTAGAVMIRPMTELEIECTLATLPEYVEVIVTEMQAGDSIMASQVSMPDAGIRLMSPPDAVVAHIVVQSEEKTGEAVAADGTAAPAQPTVIAEKKAEERAAAKADPKAGDKKK